MRGGNDFNHNIDFDHDCRNELLRTFASQHDYFDHLYQHDDPHSVPVFIPDFLRDDERRLHRHALRHQSRPSGGQLHDFDDHDNL